MFPVTNISNAQPNKVTSSQFAVESKVKQRKLTSSMTKLKPDADGPDVLELQWCLLSDDLAFVPSNLLRRDWGIFRVDLQELAEDQLWTGRKICQIKGSLLDC